MLGIYFAIFCSLNEGELFRTELRWAALSTTGLHLVNCGKPRNTKKNKKTFWCSGTQTVSVIICLKTWIPINTAGLKKLNESEKMQLNPGSENSLPLYHTHRHTHTLIAFTGTNAAQQPAQQQFPWSVTHTQRARAEVWSPDVKDCLGQCGPGMGQTHTDAHSQKQTNANTRRLHYHRKMRQAGCVRSENPGAEQRHFSCSWTPEIKCAELASPSTNPDLWTQNYTL